MTVRPADEVPAGGARLLTCVSRRASMVALMVAITAVGCGGDGGDTDEERAAVTALEPTGSDEAASRDAAPSVDASVIAPSDIAAAKVAAAVDRGDVAADSSAVGTSNSASDPGVLDDWPAARFATPGVIPESPQRAGDPERGRRALVEEGYVACGLPTRVVRELLADAPVTTLPDREAVADGLPYSMNVSTDANGVELATGNCLACHGTPLFGDVVIGLGNEFLDFTENPSVAVERAGALVRGPDETAAWERYADRIHAIAPHMTMQTVGTNPANNLTFALIAHRDAETAAWSESPILPLPTRQPPPVSVPPWWRMGKKHAMFNLGEGRGDHARIMMAASMLCTDSVEQLEVIDAYAADARAFIANLDAPVWPFALDADLAVTGREVFEANCSACHGRYATDTDGKRRPDDDVYPNRLVPIEVLGTDPTLVEQAHSAEGAAYADWFNRSWYGELSTAAAGPGHVAPPLDGIWATGPFLHNGSVPSVRALLDSETRPARWSTVPRDASDPGSYDTVNLGWQHVSDASTLAQQEPKRVYDTSRPGHAASGHRFGDHLTGDERDAVIEYLKTL